MPEKPAPDLDALLRYRQKRDFSTTPEPATGSPPEEAADLTFVVQKHDATRLHYDFRLEVDGVLVSWAVPRGPSLNPQDKRMATHVEDHPFDYGGFEGVIPKGNYGAGEVIVWDRGTYSPDEDGQYSWGDRAAGNERMRHDIERGKVSVSLRGRKLVGSWTLVRTKRDPKDWLLIKHRDEHASERDVTEDGRSVISGLTLQNLREGRMPRLGDGGARRPHPAAVEAPFPDATTLRPMLAQLVDRPFSRKGWLFEPKLDGVRALAFVRDGRVELRSRRGNAVTLQYPEVVEALKPQLVRTAVFDGEIVALNEEGAPEFQAIQPRINLSKPAEVERMAAETPVFYYVFDLLYLDGYDVRSLPLTERKALLRRTLEQSDHLKYVDCVADGGEALYEAALKLGFEGIVGKRATSAYEPDRRSGAWMKVKSGNEQDFVIGGYSEGEGSRSKTFGGLLVGYYRGDDLVFASSVGSGLTDRMLDEVTKRLHELRADEAPFANPPTAVGGRRVGGKAARCFWVQPELVCSVQFSSWTRDGNLRAPVFKGMRADIEPRSVHREDKARASVDVIAAAEETTAASGDTELFVERAVEMIIDQLDSTPKSDFLLHLPEGQLKLTNLDKVLWPETDGHPARTKRDLIRYYTRVAPWLLPHLKDRPLTLTRYPNGIHDKSFYQKHWPQAFPKEINVERVMLYSSHNDGDGEYIVCNNLETLVWLAQLADVEMHAWMARVNPEPDARDKPAVFWGSEENMEASVLNYPDYMIFDLDPYIYKGTEKQGEEPALNRKAFEKTREIAFALKELLQQLRLSSFVKTTGKTGLHVYVPVLRQYTYDEIRAATQTIGQYLLQLHPNELTMEWQTQKRTGKIFFDHNQNTRGKTLAAQYSLRPSSGATVSAPVTWDELPRVYPTDFGMDTMPERLATTGDVWADILDAKQNLAALLGA